VENRIRGEKLGGEFNWKRERSEVYRYLIRSFWHEVDIKSSLRWKLVGIL
jgi:hypothetical protein